MRQLKQPSGKYTNSYMLTQWLRLEPLELKSENGKRWHYNFQFDGVIDMKIREVNENKKQFISLLLLADEQESMVDRYLEKGTMYVLEDNDVKAECVVTDEGNKILEIKNIAVNPENQGKAMAKH